MKRILVCEDEDAIRDFVVINLVRSGYDVVDVSCGEDAVKVYTEQNGNFDVALLDIMMPGMDGFALCRWIREQSSEIGIIMLSAKSQEMDKVNCLMIGADDYVTKPFSPSELVARVDAIYRRVNVTQARQDTVKNIILNNQYRTHSALLRTNDWTKVSIKDIASSYIQFFHTPNYYIDFGP